MNPGMRQYELLSGMEGVSSGASATLKVPINRRHLLIRLFCAATIGGVASVDAGAIIDTITTMIGGRVIRQENAADIISARLFKRLPADVSGALCLEYAEPTRSDVIDEIVTAWDTYGDVPDMTLKIKLKSGLVNPSIVAVNVFDNSVLSGPDGKKIRQIVKRTTNSYNLGALGDINSLPVDLPILGMYLIGQGGGITIDHVRVTVDDTVVVHDMDRAQNAAFQADYNLDSTQFSYPLRFDVEGQIGRRLEGIRSLKVRVTSSAAQTVQVVLEQVAPDYV